MAIRPSLADTGWAFAGDECSDLGTALANVLHALKTAPRLLGLGEAMHGEEALPRLRNRVFRHLVEHEGYRSIALESSWLAGLTVDAFVTRGAGSLEAVLRHGFSHGFGESASNRQLLHWMREYNRDRPPADRLRFFGFDAPVELAVADSPRRALTALHCYLDAHLDAGLLPCGADTVDRLLGTDERWTNPAATFDPAQSVGASTNARELRLIADDLLTVLAAQAPFLIATTSRDDWWRASLHGRSAAGLLRYHAAMADTTATPLARLTRQSALRDTMMADNLVAIADSQRHQGPTLVFAHNRHLQKDKSRWQLPAGWGPLSGEVVQWWSAGALVDARLGDQYAFLASALGTIPHHGIGTPPTDTVEGVLSALPENRYVIDSRRLTAALDGMGIDLVPRTGASDNYSYFPLDPHHLGDTDGIVFLTDIAAEPTGTPGADNVRQS